MQHKVYNAYICAKEKKFSELPTRLYYQCLLENTCHIESLKKIDIGDKRYSYIMQTELEKTWKPSKNMC
jgi:hypothetical protein